MNWRKPLSTLIYLPFIMLVILIFLCQRAEAVEPGTGMIIYEIAGEWWAYTQFGWEFLGPVAPAAAPAAGGGAGATLAGGAAVAGAYGVGLTSLVGATAAALVLTAPWPTKPVITGNPTSDTAMKNLCCWAMKVLKIVQEIENQQALNQQQVYDVEYAELIIEQYDQQFGQGAAQALVNEGFCPK